MLNPSIIPAKINNPRPRVDVVMRPRVMQLLDEGLQQAAALILISAPAGYGKTTLVSNWLRTLGRRYAWLSLSTADDSLPRFSAYVLAALQKVYPTVGQHAQQVLEGAGTFASDTLVVSLSQDLAKLSKPMTLVLDDYHCIESQAVHDLVEMLVEHTQPYLQLVITTRKKPPLALARWRARNQLTELGAVDLQFTLEETTEFLQRVMRLDLAKSEIQLLKSRTAGWVVGLQLAALSIRNHRDQPEAWTIKGGQRDIADYLMAEVVGLLPKASQDFLLQTSIVERLNAGLCDALTERPDSQSVLAGLENDNLFIQALDDERDWYRYHPLFSEFLQKRLLSEYSETAISALHQRASRWFAQHADILSAIDHALAAKDFEYAAQLIGPQAEQWMRRGEVATILEKLQQLPDELVARSAGLCIWYGWVSVMTDLLDQAEHWVGRAQRLLMPNPLPQPLDPENFTTDFRNAYAQVLAIQAMLARRRSAYEQAVTLGEQALQMIPKTNLNLPAIVSAGLSSARLEAGDFEQAEILTSSTQRMAQRAGHPYVLFTMLMNESALALMQGKLHQAYAASQEALQLTELEAMPHLAFLPRIRLGRIHYIWHELATARAHLQAGIRHSNPKEYAALVVNGYINLALCFNASGEYVQALHTLSQGKTMARKFNQSVVLERVQGLRARMQLAAGESEATKRWLKTSGWEMFDPFRSSLTFADEPFFAVCRYWIALAEPIALARIANLLAWRLKDSEKQNRNSTILEIRIMQALLYQAQAQTQPAQLALTQALDLAEPENYLSPFLEESLALTPLLQAQASHKFAQQVLKHVPATIHSNVLIEALSEQETQILRLLAQGESNPEIARARVLAVSTVRWYVKQIFRKLGVHNRTQAAAQARKLNLL